MTTGPSFQDRPSAGRALAVAVERRLLGQPCHVYGLARGGVLVAAPVAERLGAKLDVLVASKIGAPGQPEYAVGAVAEGGGLLWDRAALDALGLGPEWQQRAAMEVALEVERRRLRYRRHELPVDPEALALVVDDGIATGATVRAALRGLAALGARRRAIATPVASREAVRALEGDAEWVAALLTPDPFLAVGAHYLDFEPVGDEELMRVLERAA
jgi:putative phosphoribosyl transferase